MVECKCLNIVQKSTVYVLHACLSISCDGYELTVFYVPNDIDKYAIYVTVIYLIFS